MSIPLTEAKVGDVVIDQRIITRRIPRTTKYVAAVVEGVVIEAASRENRFTVVVQFPEGRRGRNGQFIQVRRGLNPEGTI